MEVNTYLNTLTEPWMFSQRAIVENKLRENTREDMPLLIRQLINMSELYSQISLDSDYRLADDIMDYASFLNYNLSENFKDIRNLLQEKDKIRKAKRRADTMDYPLVD